MSLGGNSGDALPEKKRAIRLKTMDDVRVEMARVYSDARRNSLAPENASKLVYILAQVGRVIEGVGLEDRIKALEAKASS
jgi:hypothetical protein